MRNCITFANDDWMRAIQGRAARELQVIRRTFPVSMEEKEKSYVFTAEVPGLTAKDVKASPFNDHPTLLLSNSCVYETH